MHRRALAASAALAALALTAGPAAAHVTSGGADAKAGLPQPTGLSGPVAGGLVNPAATLGPGDADACDGLTAQASCTFLRPIDLTPPEPNPNTAVGPKLVAWTSGVDPNPFHAFRGGIFIAEINGANPRKIITFDNGHRDFEPHGLNFPDDHPSFSPDGRRIAWASNRADRNNWDIYVANVNGTGIVRLTTHPGLDTEPVFSPDGTKIVWASEAEGELDIWEMSVTGAGKRRLSPPNAEEDIEPAFSPDGSTIVFSRVQSDDEKDLFLMRSDGTGLRQLTFVGREDHDATFSPDGSKVVMTSERPPTSPPFGNVHVLSTANGASLGDLTADVDFGAGDPSWSFDGTKIAYFKSVLPTLGPMRLFVMNADGSGKLHIPGEGVVNVHPHIGRRADTDGDGTPDYRESGSVGDALLSAPSRIRAERTATVRFGWRHPRRWRLLGDVDLVLVHRGRGVAGIRLDQRARTLALWDAARGHWGPGQRIGARGVLRAGVIALDLRRSRFINTSRRTLTLELALRFERKAAGRRFALEAHANDARGNDQADRLRRSLLVTR